MSPKIWEEEVARYIERLRHPSSSVIFSPALTKQSNSSTISQDTMSREDRARLLEVERQLFIEQCQTLDRNLKAARPPGTLRLRGSLAASHERKMQELQNRFETSILGTHREHGEEIGAFNKTSPSEQTVELPASSRRTTLLHTARDPIQPETPAGATSRDLMPSNNVPEPTGGESIRGHEQGGSSSVKSFAESSREEDESGYVNVPLEVVSENRGHTLSEHNPGSGASSGPEDEGEDDERDWELCDV